MRSYGNTFSTATFDPRYTFSTLNYALQAPEKLTYRQLCLLRIFGRPEPLPPEDSGHMLLISSLGGCQISIMSPHPLAVESYWLKDAINSN